MTCWPGNPAEWSEVAPVVEQISSELEAQESVLEILERTSELEKRRRKYLPVQEHETWVSRWLASPVAYLFPDDRREEWLGDLYEVHRQMLQKSYPRWLVNLVDVGRTCVLIVSVCRIKISDLFPVEKRD